jgi:hypothetical protein
VDHGLQDARLGDALEVFAGLAQSAAQALDRTDSEPPLDESIEREPADDEVATGGRAVETRPLERVELDKSQVPPTLVRVVRIGADPVEVPIALETTPRDGDGTVDALGQLLCHRRDVDALDDSRDRRSLPPAWKAFARIERSDKARSPLLDYRRDACRRPIRTKIIDHVDRHCRDFIARSAFFLFATADARAAATSRLGSP